MAEPQTLPDRLGSLVNRILSPIGLMLTRAHPGQAESWRAYVGGPYRSDRQVIRLAELSGSTVSNYLERQWGDPGRSRRIVTRLAGAGAVPAKLETVLEIGPGAGGYIDVVRQRASPDRYEIYEIESGRARWLSATRGVVPMTTGGEKLDGTPTGSIQLVHAHGVFSSLKAISCFAYFDEMARVTAPGGYVCFDIMDDACLTEEDVGEWLASPLRYVHYLPSPRVVEFFRRRGFELAERFQEPLLIFGRCSTYLVFRKTDG